MSNYRLMVFILILFIFTGLTTAQENRGEEDGKPFVIGKTYSLESKILKETREVIVYLPWRYERDKDAAFPVIYLLDGSGNFRYFTGLVHQFSVTARMPGCIVVGINNTDRTRDMTPTHTTKGYFGNIEPHFRTSGGGDNFLSFIKDELMPYIEKTYRTEPFKILVGHSLGGVFAIHALLKSPGVFNAHIAVSPALYWDDAILVKRAKEFLQKPPEFKSNTFLYISTANEGERYEKTVNQFTALLKENKPPLLTWIYEPFPQESHGSTTIKSYHNALKFFFPDWTPSGILRWKPEKIVAHYKHLTETYGFKISMPRELLEAVGRFALREKRYKDAIYTYTYCIKKNPGDARYYNGLGQAYEQDKQLENAIKYYKLAIEKNKDPKAPGLQQYKESLERVKKEHVKK